MKNKFYSLFIFFVLTALAGCNEKESTDVIEQGDPQITEFTPTSGKFGQEITIKGEFLRDIQKATIGGVEATIRYKLSQQEIVIVVPANAGNGKIVLSTKEKKTESEQSFTIVYPVPQVKNVPAEAHVGDQIEIQGENLDIVSKVCFGDKEASISYQSEREIVATIPFVITDAAPISLYYLDSTGEQFTQPEGPAFEIIKDIPTIDAMAERVTEGSLITLNGTFLNLIESIHFGDEVKVTNFVEKTANSIVFRVPELPESATVDVLAKYYEGTGSLTLRNDCYVFIPRVFSYPNLKMGAHRNEDFGNMINGTTGQVSTTCILKDIDSRALIDFATVHNSNNDFALNGPQNVKANLRNYWCNGTPLPPLKSSSTEAEVNENFGEFTSTVTKLLVLQESKGYGELIRNIKEGNIEEISPTDEITKALFNIDMDAEGSNSVRSRQKTEAEDKEASNIYKPGSVVVFKNLKKNKFGIMIIRSVNVDFDAVKATNDANATITFDLYYQRY